MKVRCNDTQRNFKLFKRLRKVSGRTALKSVSGEMIAGLEMEKMEAQDSASVSTLRMNSRRSSKSSIAKALRSRPDIPAGVAGANDCTH